MTSLYRLALTICVFGLFAAQVKASCTSCAYKTAQDKCTDLYTPRGREQDVCKTLDTALCKKYNGGYTIYCLTGGSSSSCSRTGTSCNKAGISSVTPSLVLLSIAVAFFTKTSL